MGHAEAVEDKIRFATCGKYKKFYYPKCSICGDEVKSMNYLRSIKYTCARCKYIKAMVEEKYRLRESKNNGSAQLSRAIERISKKANIANYQRAVNDITADMEEGVRFGSTEEVITALELKRLKVKYRHNVKFGRYRADFVLDELKIILEVDGRLYHTKETAPREELRDNLITLSVGAEWEVIRITDNLINDNITQLMRAVRIVVKERKKIRLANAGELPSWYSRRKV